MWLMTGLETRGGSRWNSNYLKSGVQWHLGLMPQAFSPVCVCLRSNWKLDLPSVFSPHNTKAWFFSLRKCWIFLQWKIDFLQVFRHDSRWSFFQRHNKKWVGKQLIFKKEQHFRETFQVAFYSTGKENSSLLSTPSLSSLAWEVQKESVPFWTDWCHLCGQEERSRQLQVSQPHLSAS